MSVLDGSGAVGGYMKLVPSHVGVVRAEQDADVGRDARDEKLGNIECEKEDLKRCGVECRALGLENMVIARLRAYQVDHLAALFGILHRPDECAEVLLPFTEIVVDEEYGDLGAPGTVAQF